MKKLLASLFVFTVILSGCESIEDQYSIGSEGITSAIAESKRYPEPLKAYQVLEKYYDNTVNASEVNGVGYSLSYYSNIEACVRLIPAIGKRDCKELKESTEFYNLMINNLMQSLNSNEIDAYNVVYSSHMNIIYRNNEKMGHAVSNLRAMYATKLSALADKIPNNKENSVIYMLTGNLYGNGLYVTKSNEKSNYYYEKAYASGSTIAAAYIAKNYFDIGEYENAYFWTVRCTVACSDNYGVVKLEYKEFLNKLSPNKFREIEKKATDQSTTKFL